MANVATHRPAMGGMQFVLHNIERKMTAAVEFIAAGLIVVEIIIMLVGVVARYVFSAPLTWSDELAGILFLWLGMLASVIAWQRGQHMAIRVMFRRLGPTLSRYLDCCGRTTALGVFAIATYCGFEHALSEASVSTSALEISGTWRAAALPVGFLLMFLLAAGRTLRESAVSTLVSTAIVSGLVSSLWLASGAWSSDVLNLLLYFVVVVAAVILSGMPIAVAFLTATMLYLAFNSYVPLTVVIGRVDEGMSHFILLSVPLFVFLGRLMEETGMARAIMAFLSALIGHVRGGLSYVLLAAMFIVSGISGSKVADMAAVAPILFPDMKRRGWKPGELIALLSSSGAMAETIPPSLILITTGVTAGVSIAALFTAGLLPALLLASLLCGVVWWRSQREERRPVASASARMIATTGVAAFPGLILPLVIRCAVVQGVATPTEVSTIGIVYTMLTGMLIYRPFPWRRLGTMLVETASLSGAILFIVGAATAMAWAVTQSGFSEQLSSLMTRLPGGPMTFMAVSIVFFILLGSLLEGLPAIVLFAPLLFPTAATLGIHEVHYAIVVVLAMGIGLFVPPFGVGYWAACAIGQVAPDEGIKPLVPYLAALLVGVAIIAAVPWISLGFL
jgi:tripartite ATP-independent transporter DctM subunit